MDNFSQKHSQAETVNVYVGDEITERVTRDKAREMKAAGTHFFINHGKDLRLAKHLYEALKTELEERLGWMPPFGRFRSTALNEGRKGQFPIGYPIPYVFDGHLKMPKASEVNA